jgi:hypothetical protein
MCQLSFRGISRDERNKQKQTILQIVSPYYFLNAACIKGMLDVALGSDG